jgi:hypothetical protein
MNAASYACRAGRSKVTIRVKIAVLVRDLREIPRFHVGSCASASQDEGRERNRESWLAPAMITFSLLGCDAELREDEHVSCRVFDADFFCAVEGGANWHRNLNSF